jgi:hypothetical protein
MVAFSPGKIPKAKIPEALPQAYSLPKRLSRAEIPPRGKFHVVAQGLARSAWTQVRLRPNAACSGMREGL